MTAWHLRDDWLQISNAWRNGTYTWEHQASGFDDWIARFVYDQASGQTRELAWYYRQVHVQ